MAEKASSKKFDTEQISIRVSTQLLDKLERLGEPFGIKRSQLIHRAIEEYVQRHEATHAPRLKQ